MMQEIQKYESNQNLMSHFEGRARLPKKVLPKGSYWQCYLAQKQLVGFNFNPNSWIPCISLIQKQASNVLKTFFYTWF